MRSPQGWEEPGQTPEFDEFTLVLKGTVRVRHHDGEMDVTSGQAVIAHAGEWIQYSRRLRVARNISPSVCRPSRWRQFTATSDRTARQTS